MLDRASGIYVFNSVHSLLLPIRVKKSAPRVFNPPAPIAAATWIVSANSSVVAPTSKG